MRKGGNHESRGIDLEEKHVATKINGIEETDKEGVGFGVEVSIRVSVLGSCCVEVGVFD